MKNTMFDNMLFAVERRVKGELVNAVPLTRHSHGSALLSVTSRRGRNDFIFPWSCLLFLEWPKNIRYVPFNQSVKECMILQNISISQRVTRSDRFNDAVFEHNYPISLQFYTQTIQVIWTPFWSQDLSWLLSWIIFLFAYPRSLVRKYSDCSHRLERIDIH